MGRVFLDGDWQLFHFPEGNYSVRCPDDLLALNLASIPAHTPGNVELDLLRAGVIPDPFYADNISLLRPFEAHEWWYLRQFELPTQSVEQNWDLVFAGLDTLATIWVNGKEIGRAANMLIEQHFDATRVLQFGLINRIAVRLQSAAHHAQRFHYDAATRSWEHREEGLFIRKAPHMWGWDIMPRAVSAGIWRSVWLEPRPACVFEQVYYWTISAEPGQAVLGVRFQFRTDAPTLDGLRLSFRGVSDDASFAFEWPVEFTAGGCEIPVPNARLWWPKGYGQPHLYTITAQLCRADEILAERVDRIGIRKAAVARTEKAALTGSSQAVVDGVTRVDVPPRPDSHFVMYVNDLPIMIKGANWAPLDAFHSRDADRVDQVVALFEDLGCNMIRCWGGNVYEDHRLFDLCDEKGILVWQDFAFACCRYPQLDDFLARVRNEVQHVVEKLRNHASLVLWCGDNEGDMTYVADGISPEYNRLTREVIPQVVHRCDPFRHYVASSPYVPPSIGATPDACHHTPEQHLWGPRGYFKGAYYTQHTAHFIGEIGYHGCPNVSSIRRFISPGQVWPWQDNPEWQTHSVYHWQHRRIERDRIQLMVNQVRELFGFVPDDLETFALASQIAQAEALKFFIESTRLRKWRTSGVLWWNVIDGWPQFSDSVVDYYFAKKLAYYYIRRVQRPVCVVIGEAGQDKTLPVVVSNDSQSAAAGQYRIVDADRNEIVAGGTFCVPTNQNWQVAHLGAEEGDRRLYLIQWEIGEITFGNHYLAGNPPVSLDRYRTWLSAIAALPHPFDPTQVAV